MFGSFSPELGVTGSFVDQLEVRIKPPRWDTGLMVDKKLPEGVKSETVTWHLEDGTPTDDKDKAATAEVTRTYADGRTEHRLMRRGSAASPGL
jgi:hypothetical protein